MLIIGVISNGPLSYYSIHYYYYCYILGNKIVMNTLDRIIKEIKEKEKLRNTYLIIGDTESAELIFIEIYELDMKFHEEVSKITSEYFYINKNKIVK